MNSKTFFKQAFNGLKNLKLICLCLAQKSFEACKSCDFIYKLFRAVQELLKNKILIKIFILWKKRSIFEKYS